MKRSLMFLGSLVAVVILLSTFSADAIVDSTLQMQLGNPSGAASDTKSHNHYLLQRSVEAIDYSDHLGQPNWVSWDLTTADIGGSGRNSSYYVDTNLPSNFTNRLSTTDYNGVGAIDFNRGHLCPSADRTDTTNDNKMLFFMSNIMPQSGPQNQGVWGNLESYCRSQLNNSELLITCGQSGFGTNTLPSGKVIIGANCWKIVVFVPLGGGPALSRISATNRVIAVSIPNVTNGLSSAWQSYITTPAQIERDTGLTFFTALPAAAAAAFTLRNDSAPVISAMNSMNNQFQFTVNGWTGTNYVVQASTDLTTTNWISLQTNAAPFNFIDANANTFSQRFYRVKIWP